MNRMKEYSFWAAIIAASCSWLWQAPATESALRAASRQGMFVVARMLHPNIPDTSGVFAAQAFAARADGKLLPRMEMPSRCLQAKMAARQARLPLAQISRSRELRRQIEAARLEAAHAVLEARLHAVRSRSGALQFEVNNLE